MIGESLLGSGEDISEVKFIFVSRCEEHRLGVLQVKRLSSVWVVRLLAIGVLPTVVSSGAIWTEIETGFHIDLEAPVRINVLPDYPRNTPPIPRPYSLAPVQP